MGRPKKPEHKKYSARVLAMALPSERESYEASAAICDKELSEWIRDTLNAEVARLSKKHPTDRS